MLEFELNEFELEFEFLLDSISELFIKDEDDFFISLFFSLLENELSKEFLFFLFVEITFDLARDNTDIEFLSFNRPSFLRPRSDFNFRFLLLSLLRKLLFNIFNFKFFNKLCFCDVTFKYGSPFIGPEFTFISLSVCFNIFFKFISNFIIII